MKLSFRILLIPGMIILLISAASRPASADVKAATDNFQDSTAHSANTLSAQQGNWVIAPIPLSNPTLGSGLELVTLYLHPPKPDTPEGVNATTGIAGLYTDNDSWGAGVFHRNSFFADRLRLFTAAGTGDFQLNYFGSSSDSVLSQNPLHYEIDMDLLHAEFQIRIPGTEHWYLGPALTRATGNINFRIGIDSDLLPNEIGAGIDTGSFALLLGYDTRNDDFYPTQGMELSASITDNSETWGSDFDYQKFTLGFSVYHPFNGQITLAFNTEIQGSSDTVPFFDLSSPQIRGYERGQLADDYALLLRGEVKYKMTQRWGIVGFADLGWVGESLDDLTSFGDRNGGSIGTGLRWQVVAGRTLNLGLDIATSDDGSAFIIRIGESF